MRFCELGDNKPVWGTDRNTGIGYCKSHQYLRTDISKETILQKAIKKQRQSVSKSTGTKVRNLVNSNPDIKPPKDYRSKSQLLKEADRLFSLFIRNRDSDKNGNISCVCCGKIYNVGDKDGYGNKIVQNLHFIQRDVYSLRFDEDNCAAGCCYCNKDMSDHPRGTAYMQYLSVMLENFGEDVVKEMQVAHRKINRIEESQLKVIIEHYSNQTP